MRSGAPWLPAKAPNCQLQSPGIFHQSRTLEVGLGPGEPEPGAEGGLAEGGECGVGVGTGTWGKMTLECRGEEERSEHFLL